MTTTATFDEQDRIVTFGTKTYAHNDAGELVSVSDSSTTPASVTSYTYDVFGNLKSVTLPNSTVITYLLDGQNRRVGKKIGTTLQKQFVWFDQLRPAGELNGSGTLVSQFVYGIKGNVPDYIIRSSVRYKLMTDHLGSVVAVVHSTNGTIAQRIEYDEFGRVLSDTSPGFQPFGFAGGLYDPDTKLVTFGVRTYDADTGRWLSKDPILFGGGQTNLFGYVNNDPVNFIDPKGRKAVCGGYFGVGICFGFDFVDGIRQQLGHEVDLAPRDNLKNPIDFFIGDFPRQDSNCILGGALCYYPNNEHTDPFNKTPSADSKQCSSTKASR